MTECSRRCSHLILLVESVSEKVATQTIRIRMTSRYSPLIFGVNTLLPQDQRLGL